MLINITHFSEELLTTFRALGPYDIPEKFYVTDNDVRYVYMLESHLGKEYLYEDSETFEVVGIDYHGMLKMFVVLPKERFGLNKVLEKLDASALIKLAKNESKKNCLMKMPRLKFDFQFDAKELLQNLGVKDAFDPNTADFSKISPDKSLILNNFLHRSSITLFEKGNECDFLSAEPRCEGPYDGRLPHIDVEITADHPFLFFISDCNHNILFLGTVVDNFQPNSPIKKIPMNIRAIKWYLNAIISPCGVMLNILLFFLIKNKSAKKLENYKKVLYMGCITDIIYGIILIISQPSMSLIHGVYFVFTEGIAGNLPHFWSTWIFIPNIFIMYFSITNAPIQFLYRYLLLCREIKLGTMAFLGLIGISILACSTFCFLWIESILSRGHKDELYYAYLLNGTEWIIDGKLPNYGAFPFREKIFGNGWISIVIISISYGLVWFCAISIFIKLKKIKTQFNRKAMKHQGQINIVLIVEALTPFITVVIPISLDIVILVLDVYLYWAGQAVTLISSFSPPINGIVKLTVITCYRRAVKEFLFKHKKFPFFVSSVSGGIDKPIPSQNDAKLISENGREISSRSYVKIV